MLVYLLNIGLLIVEAYALFLDSKKDRFKNPKRTFCILAALQWILVSGLRGLSVGADTRGYKIRRFDVTLKSSWNSIYGDFIDSIFHGADIKDPGYPILEKTFQMFSHSYQLWLVVIAIIFTVTMTIWIYRNSENVFMSFIIYSCLFYNFFGITGHRQTIATGILVFACEPLIRKRKFIPFLIMTLLMGTVHRSALICIAYYFIYNLKITKKYVFITFAVMLIIFIFRNQFQNFLADTTGYDFYREFKGAGTYRFSALLMLVMFVAIWQMREIISEHPEATHTYNAMMAAMVFLPTTFVNPNMMRVVQYFSVYLMILVPYIINSFKNKERFIAILVSVLVIVYFFIRTNPQYVFFWQ